MGTIIKKLLTLIKKQVCFLSKKIRIKELGPQEGKGRGLFEGGAQNAIKQDFLPVRVSHSSEHHLTVQI